MSWKRRPDRLVAVLLAVAFCGSAISAEKPSIPLIILDEFAADLRPLGDLLVRHGAPVSVIAMPSGRVRTLIQRTEPVCGAALIRDYPNRSGFHWIARTASFEVVVSVLHGGTKPNKGRTAAVFLNTQSQDIAQRHGYEILPVKSIDQVLPLLTSGRAAYWIAVRQEVEGLARATESRFDIVESLGRAETWLACNPATPPDAVAAITAAWRQTAASGELRDFYAQAGLLSLYPEP